MRTDPHHLRKGVGAALLEHIIGEARRRGLTQLSLETGRGPAFEPALALYLKRGFVMSQTYWRDNLAKLTERWTAWKLA